MINSERMENKETTFVLTCNSCVLFLYISITMHFIRQYCFLKINISSKSGEK